MDKQVKWAATALDRAECMLSTDRMVLAVHHDPARKTWSYDIEATMKLFKASWRQEADKLIWC